MTKTFTSVFTKERKGYVAKCIELGVVSQGKNIEEAQKNLVEAVELYLENNKGLSLKSNYSFIGSFDVKVI